MSSTTPNIGLTKTTAAETIGQNWAASNDSGGNFDIIDTKMGAVGNTSLQAQVDALSSQLTSQYGVVITDVQYEICANVVTIYLNGVTVTDSTGWTKLADLPSGLNTRYSAHFKAMSGQDIQIAGSAINYRGSAGNVFGACTYVRG